jgi:nucleotide-binding universal stress UspA family protein
MYKHILIPVENTDTDQTILRHIRPLARLTGARLTLVHVADGWAARNFDALELQESEEMKQDSGYLAGLERELKSEGFETDSVLARGDPAKEIIRLTREKGADLIAMTTHGHRFVGDVLYGSTADKVRHQVEVPVLLLKVQK